MRLLGTHGSVAPCRADRQTHLDEALPGWLPPGPAEPRVQGVAAGVAGRATMLDQAGQGRFNLGVGHSGIPNWIR